MPLPPNASITDVINKLSELEGINQKSELASVIGDPALPTDLISEQILKLQGSKDLLSDTLTQKGIPTSNNEPIADMVVKVGVLGYGYAEGTGTSSSGNQSFEFYASTSTLSRASLSVSGLNFKPKFIIITPTTLNATAVKTEYYEKLSNYTEYTQLSITSEANANNTNTIGFKAQNSGSYVNDSGFLLPVANTSTTYNWVALG